MALRAGAPRVGLTADKKKEIRAVKSHQNAQRRVAHSQRVLENHTRCTALSPPHMTLDGLVKDLEAALGGSATPLWHDVVRAITLLITETQRIRFSHASTRTDTLMDQSHFRTPLSDHESVTDDPSGEGFNIMGASQTAAVLGETTFIHGDKGSTLTSAGFVNIVAGSNAFISARTSLEIAAPSGVEIMSRHKVSLGGEEQLALHAHPRELEAGTGSEEFPKDHSLLLRGDQSALVDSLNGAVHFTAMAAAPSNNAGDVTVTAKSNVIVVAKEKDLTVQAEKGDVTLEAKNNVSVKADEEAISLAAKKAISMSSETDAVSITAKTNVSLLSKDQINVEAQDTGLKVKAKKLIDVACEKDVKLHKAMQQLLPGAMFIGFTGTPLLKTEKQLILDESPINPKYYEKMSSLLDALILQRKQQALDYQTYLEKIVELTRQAKAGPKAGTYPKALGTPALRALYDNLGRDEALALRVNEAVSRTIQDDWRSNAMKTRRVRQAIEGALGPDDARTDATFDLVKSQDDY